MILRRVSDGSQVRLGRELGRGGEGSVHEVMGQELVAKIYRRSPPPLKVDKLHAMTRQHSPALLRVAAWPLDVLEDPAHRVRGFLMPRVSAREDVHQLYSPKSRRRAFPDADFRFVVRAAANLARAFAAMHTAGHVIGDVNHGNALIGCDATVMLIDCDSFQVRDAAGRVFTCDVGVPLFSAPEIQGRVFRGLKRSRQHDDFGLAVLLFHLLFQGRHPFAGVFAGGEMPVERAIAESRFAYGGEAAARGMSAPPLTLRLDAFGPGIAALFERAFAGPGIPHRPEPSEWLAALTALERELEPCEVSKLHARRRDQPCCWCEVEGRSGVRLFGAAPVFEKLSAEAIASLWAAVQAVPRPSDDPGYPGVVSFSPAPVSAYFNPVRVANVAGFMLGGTCAAGAVATHLWGLTGGVTMVAIASVATLAGVLTSRRLGRVGRIAARRRLSKAQAHWRALEKRWNAECSPRAFNEEVQRLLHVRQQLDSLESWRRRELRSARGEQRARAREESLAGYRIEDSGVGLRPSDVATLATLGIHTAADVMRESARVGLSIPPFNANQLTTWASALDRRFRPVRGAPLDADLVAQVEQRVAHRQRELHDELRDGPAALERKRLEIDTARAELLPAIQSAWEAMKEARTKLARPAEAGEPKPG